MRSRIIRLASATLVLLSCMSSAVIHTTPATHPDAVRYATAAYMRLPLSFEANNGQTDPRVKFLTRGSGYQLFLTPTEAVLTLRQDVGGERTHKKSHHDSSEKADASSRSAVLRMKIVGGNAEPGLTGLGELTGRTNYFIGNDPEKWRTNVPNYARVEYHSVYPGVDLVYYGSQGRVEHDFVVAPGADPSQIKLSFDGANKVGIDDQGDLVLGVPGGELRLERPRMYQDINGERREIAGGYVLTGAGDFRREDGEASVPAHHIGFQVARYDPSRPLVIDPVLWYSTYLGGGSTETGKNVAVDASGNVYVVGETNSIDFPTTAPFQSQLRSIDVFVTKLTSTASATETSAFIYSTYLGGTGAEEAGGIAVDSGGNAYVVGDTNSTNFPISTAVTPIQSVLVRNDDVFVTKLNPSGTALVYSTYLGGSDFDHGQGIAVDGFGNAYITGHTESDDFPIRAAFQSVHRDAEGITDAFVTKLLVISFGFPAHLALSLGYSTYLGGTDQDEGHAIAVDSSGNAYVTGSTRSSNFPTTPNPFRADQPGGDAFVTKLSKGGSLVFSTYLGGTGDDTASSIAVDSLLNVYVTGETTSGNTFPIQNAFSATQSGPRDVFVTKFNSDGASLVFSTFLGGSNTETASGITVDSARNVWVTGSTFSSDFPTKNALQSHLAGSTASLPTADAFVTQIKAGGSQLAFSTYLGGSSGDTGNSIAVDSSDNIYVAGDTFSTDFPTKNALQSVIHGFRDAFVLKIGATLRPDLTGSWSELSQTCRGRGPVCSLQGVFEVQNVGTADASNSQLRFYLSSDAKLDGSDRLIGKVAVGELREDESKTRILNAELAGSASGLFVIAFVDAGSDLQEPDEINNVVAFGPIP